jgi:hypothetical protein
MVIQKLGDTIRILNRHADRLHTPLKPCGLSPYQVLGRLAQAQSLNVIGQYPLLGAEQWTSQQYDEHLGLAAELEERLVSRT